MAVWADDYGAQSVKWSAADEITASVSVSDRNYYIAHKENRAWPLNLAPDVPTTLPQSFYLEPIFSRPRGENVAIYSIPFTNFWEWRQYLIGEPVIAYIEFRP